ncbi:helix-turn-helix domain-containing protein [Cyanobacteria bacterium FACHB-63]|nr:helix-turn-helix domain-containing protein [Cyanobacteria bacterium FACHB-63]
MAKHITEEQLNVLRLLVVGKSSAEIQEETGVSVRTIARWKVRFSGLLSQGDDAIAATLLEARTATASLIVGAVDELARLLRTSDQVQDKLGIIDRIFRAHQILSPSPTQGSVSIQASDPGEAPGRVVIQLPHNNRDDR